MTVVTVITNGWAIGQSCRKLDHRAWVISRRTPMIILLGHLHLPIHKPHPRIFSDSCTVALQLYVLRLAAQRLPSHHRYHLLRNS